MARLKNVRLGSMAECVFESGLIHAAGFPKAIPCLELVLECRDKYDAAERCIQNYNGEVLIYVNRVTVMGALRIPPKEEYQDWTISLSYSFPVHYHFQGF